MPQGLAIATVDVSFPLLAPDGSAGAPSYSFLADTAMGMYRRGADQLSFALQGQRAVDVEVNSLTVQQLFGVNALQLLSGDVNAGAAVGSSGGYLRLFAATDIVEQRRTTNAQFLRVYNTYTSGAVYERASIGWGEFNSGTIANFFVISTQAAGGASARSIWINSADNLYFTAGGAGSGQWRLMTSGHFMCVTDNTYDLGQPSFTPRNIYAGTQFIAPAGSSAAPSYTFAGSAVSLASGIYGSNIDVNGVTIHFKTATGSGKTFIFEDAATATLLEISAGSVAAAIPVYGPSGSAAAPSFAFSSDTNTGVYSYAADELGFAAGGGNVGRIASYGLVTARFFADYGDSTNPGYCAAGDQNTGMFFNVGAVADTIGLTCGGTLIATVAAAALTSTVAFVSPQGLGYTFSGGSTASLTAGGGYCIVNSGNDTNIALITTDVILPSTTSFKWSTGGYNTGTYDVYLSRLTTASLRLGGAPSATPVAYTFTIGESSRGTTDNNVAGANGTLRCGAGTGNAAGASLIFETPTPTASGVVAQAYAQRLSLSVLGATFDIPDQGLRINNQVNGAGASAGTLTNAPSAGNPNFWLPINIAGTVRFAPLW